MEMQGIDRADGTGQLPRKGAFDHRAAWAGAAAMTEFVSIVTEL
jgi:hypothetical protein